MSKTNNERLICLTYIRNELYKQNFEAVFSKQLMIKIKEKKDKKEKSR